MSSQPHSWAQLLPMAEFMHNLWKHDTMQKTLHELLTRTNPQINVQLIKENVPAAVN